MYKSESIQIYPHIHIYIYSFDIAIINADTNVINAIATIVLATIIICHIDALVT